MTDEQLKAKSNAILDKLEEDGFDLFDWSIEDAHNNGFIDGYHEGFKDCAKSRLNVTTISDCPIKDEEESKYKTAYIKGIRTMANALKDYDRTDGAWTDYFEHTVDKVLKRLLQESE